MREQIFISKEGNGLCVELCFEGRMTMDHVRFLADAVKKYRINKITLNLDASITVWNLDEERLAGFRADLEKEGIPYRGACSFKRQKVFCSPLGGLEYGELADVRIMSETARAWMDAQDNEDRFTVYFSGGTGLVPEAYRCNVIFEAMEDARMRILVRKPEGTADGCHSCEASEEAFFVLAENTEVGRYMAYFKTIYELRGKAGSETEFRGMFWPAFAALPEEERASKEIISREIPKEGNGEFTCGPKIVKQKQEDLYAIEYHPLGGVINVAFWHNLLKAVKDYKELEIRIDHRMNLYVCNLLAEEVHLPLDAMTDGAHTTAEKAVVRSYCGLCRFGNIDAQMFQKVMIGELRKMNFPVGAVPTFTFTGCKRACGWVPATQLRFIGMDEAPEGKSGKWLQVQTWGEAEHAEVIGEVPQKKVVELLIALGAMAQNAGTDFAGWMEMNPGLLPKICQIFANDEE